MVVCEAVNQGTDRCNVSPGLRQRTVMGDPQEELKLGGVAH